MKVELEFLDEHGHLKEPNEYLLFMDAQQKIIELEKTFTQNGRNLNAD